jgi:hypothetical protein
VAEQFDAERFTLMAHFFENSAARFARLKKMNAAQAFIDAEAKILRNRMRDIEAMLPPADGVALPSEPSDTERLAMVLHLFEQRDDNMPLTPSERDVLIAFNARGEYTKSMRQRVIDSAIRAALADGVIGSDRNTLGPSTPDGDNA